MPVILEYCLFQSKLINGEQVVQRTNVIHRNCNGTLYV